MQGTITALDARDLSTDGLLARICGTALAMERYAADGSNWYREGKLAEALGEVVRRGGRLDRVSGFRLEGRDCDGWTHVHVSHVPTAIPSERWQFEPMTGAFQSIPRHLSTAKAGAFVRELVSRGFGMR